MQWAQIARARSRPRLFDYGLRQRYGAISVDMEARPAIIDRAWDYLHDMMSQDTGWAWLPEGIHQDSTVRQPWNFDKVLRCLVSLPQRVPLG